MDAISQQAMDRKTGARGLRSIMVSPPVAGFMVEHLYNYVTQTTVKKRIKVYLRYSLCMWMWFTFKKKRNYLVLFFCFLCVVHVCLVFRISYQGWWILFPYKLILISKYLQDIRISHCLFQGIKYILLHPLMSVIATAYENYHFEILKFIDF